MLLLGEDRRRFLFKKIIVFDPVSNYHFDWFKITNTFFLSYSQRFDSSQVAKPTYRLPIILIIFHNATIFFSFLSTVILCRIINDGADDVLIPRIYQNIGSHKTTDDEMMIGAC